METEREKRVEIQHAAAEQWGPELSHQPRSPSAKPSDTSALQAQPPAGV